MSETRDPLDMCPFFLPGWLPSHVSLRSPLLLSLAYAQCLFRCIFYKSVFFWINLSTSACVSSVRLTPPSCLLDLFIMPARGDCVSNTITLLVFFSQSSDMRGITQGQGLGSFDFYIFLCSFCFPESSGVFFQPQSIYILSFHAPLASADNQKH